MKPNKAQIPDKFEAIPTPAKTLPLVSQPKEVNERTEAPRKFRLSELDYHYGSGYSVGGVDVPGDDKPDVPNEPSRRFFVNEDGNGNIHIHDRTGGDDNPHIFLHRYNQSYHYANGKPYRTLKEYMDILTNINADNDTRADEHADDDREYHCASHRCDCVTNAVTDSDGDTNEELCPYWKFFKVAQACANCKIDCFYAGSKAPEPRARCWHLPEYECFDPEQACNICDVFKDHCV